MTTTAAEPSEMACGVAARCWTDAETSSRIMDAELATAFAKRVEGYLYMIEAAWGIIANSNHGNWEEESVDWQGSAATWRQSYHDMLSKHGDPRPAPVQALR